MDPLIGAKKSTVLSDLLKCKSLARIIKSQRTLPWPCPPTADLPEKDVTDTLVDCYLRSVETIYRILHVPSFKRDYETMWIDAKPRTAFLVQLKLVLAIGATTYDEHFSLRTSAVRWVYEAQTWISEPEFKSRLGVEYLQTNILLLLARETAGVAGDSIWVSAGELLRRAMSMGLHRDPAYLPAMSVLFSETRRRLWSTVLEIALQSCLASGGPPLVSFEDFDTEIPGNFDDDQLMGENPLAKPEDCFTDASISIALRKTLPPRLSVAKLLNDVGAKGTYDDILRLDAELQASHKALGFALQRYKTSDGPSPSRFSLDAVNFILLRYLLSLHAPFFVLALNNNAAYSHSRKVVVQTSLKLWCAAHPTSSVAAGQEDCDAATLGKKEDLELFASFGMGFYRISTMLAFLFIAVEIEARIEEEGGWGPIPLQPYLLSLLDEAKTWGFDSVKSGETGVKGYMVICVVAANVKGRMRQLGIDGLKKTLLKALEDSVQTCLPILERMAFPDPACGEMDDLLQISLDSEFQLMPDWNFIVSSTKRVLGLSIFSRFYYYNRLRILYSTLVFRGQRIVR